MVSQRAADDTGYSHISVLFNEFEHLLGWSLESSELGKVISLIFILLTPAFLGGGVKLRLLRLSLKILELSESCFVSLYNSWP